MKVWWTRTSPVGTGSHLELECWILARGVADEPLDPNDSEFSTCARSPNREPSKCGEPNVREVTRRVAWPATGRNARLKPHSEFLVRALPYILSQPPHGIMQVRAARPIRNV